MAEEDGDITFEEQLALEEKEKSLQLATSAKDKVKVDDDGTVYDWDADRKAWFPRINDDFLAQYHMNYGSDVTDVTSGQQSSPTAQQQVDFAAIPPMPDPSDAGYADWYYKYADLTNSQQYKDWYEYYYGGGGGGRETEEVSDTDAEPTAHALDPQDERYWEQLTAQAASDAASGITPRDQSQDQSQDQPRETGDQSQDQDKKGKKKKKEKAPVKPAAWFEMQDEDNTNVYISGLPPSITMETFKDLCNKCGLIAFDPLTRKPKLKLYRDPEGNPKGDGLCCYIKQESVELALNILDGYVYSEGHTLTVERAKFTLKGAFDPKKRTKRKLTNKEKKAFKEKQAKLFEWRPDKPRFARSRHEKTVIVTNVFDVREFDENPLLVTELEQDLRGECAKYGQVKKLRIHERNTEGAVSITYGEPEEADTCKLALNGRWFSQRQLKAETWDGKTRYEVEETEEQYRARIKKWEEYLNTGGKSENNESKSQAETSEKSTAILPTNNTQSAPNEPENSSTSPQQSVQGSHVTESAPGTSASSGAENQPSAKIDNSGASSADEGPVSMQTDPTNEEPRAQAGQH